MKLHFYTYKIYVLFLLLEEKKIIKERFYLPEIDYFLLFLERGIDLINRFNLFGNYKNKVFRLIYISDIDIDNAFNFFDPVGFVKETYVPEIKIITQNKTFQNMVIHAEESFFYVNHSLETC